MITTSACAASSVAGGRKVCMKIRLKNEPLVIREVEEIFWPNGYRWQGILTAVSDHLKLYRESHWEPVPEETWVDVTEQMQHYETSYPRTHFHRNKGTVIDVLTMAEGYRLRKVLMPAFPDTAYFIVEKLVPSKE